MYNRSRVVSSSGPVNYDKYKYKYRQPYMIGLSASEAIHVACASSTSSIYEITEFSLLKKKKKKKRRFQSSPKKLPLLNLTLFGHVYSALFFISFLLFIFLIKYTHIDVLYHNFFLMSMTCSLPQIKNTKELD